MSDEKIGLAAEVATAIAAVTYPIVKVVSGMLERRRIRNARRFNAAAIAVETRLMERCRGLEERLSELEARW
jgi:hypothetical protein